MGNRRKKEKRSVSGTPQEVATGFRGTYVKRGGGTFTDKKGKRRMSVKNKLGARGRTQNGSVRKKKMMQQ